MNAHTKNQTADPSQKRFGMTVVVGWAGFIKPNIGDYIKADVGQTIRLFTQPTKQTMRASPGQAQQQLCRFPAIF
jgi:hypothetical protein